MKKTTRDKGKGKTRLEKVEPEEFEEMPDYKILYPPLKELFLYDENFEIENKLLKIKSDISKRKRRKSFLNEEQELDEKFLSRLVEIPCTIPKKRLIETISKFIQKSKLMEKLKNDSDSADKKTAASSLSRVCAEKLKYEVFQTGEIIFKIGDLGENFYFILSGNVSVLKLKKLPNIKMTYMEYIKYCIFLLNQGEEYLLNQVIKSNAAVLNVSSIEDIKLINKIIFMKRLNQDINKNITNNKQLKDYFVLSGQKYSDYDLKQDELDAFEQEKLKGKQGAGKNWEEYITKRCSLLVSDQVFFHPYGNILTDNEPKNILCYSYDPFLYLGPGFFFGDTALDFENSKRNATIRAEEKTYLAYLQRDDYLNIISPMNKMERIKEIDFLYTNFFFMSINSHIFEKNFFHLFSLREYFRGSILFSQGNIPLSLLFLKTGKISLELKCSIIDIQNIIKFLYENIFLNPIYQKLSQMQKNRYMPLEKMSRIKSYINDPVLLRLKTHNKNFIDEMKVIRVYNITILTNNEVIGLEEIFIRMPYISKASVISHKVECYELSLSDLDRLLNCGRDVLLSYLKYTMNKISSLIERLQNIKQNYINMSLAKFEGKNNEIQLKNILSMNVNFRTSPKYSNEENKYNNYSYENNSERKIVEFIHNKNEFTTKNGTQKSSSPIKIFMTSLSLQSQTRFEEMKIAFSKLKKLQFKTKSNKFFKEPFNNRKTFNKSLVNKRVDSINNKIDEKKKNPDINNKTSSVIYNPDDKLNTKYLIDKLFLENTEEKDQTAKSNEIYQEPTLRHKYSIHNRNTLIQEPISKHNTFNLSYIPLNLMCQKEEKNKAKTLFNNINELLTTNQNIQKIFSMKNSIRSSGKLLINDNNDNNEIDSKSKTVNSNTIINNKKNNFKKRLKSLNKNISIANLTKENNLDKPSNIIPRKIIISGVIKDFYKDMKINGYSSVIKNRKLNTIYMRKFNKKYDSAEKAYQNIKNQLLKKSNSLPQIL